MQRVLNITPDIERLSFVAGERTVTVTFHYRHDMILTNESLGYTNYFGKHCDRFVSVKCNKEQFGEVVDFIGSKLHIKNKESRFACVAETDLGIKQLLENKLQLRFPLHSSSPANAIMNGLRFCLLSMEDSTFTYRPMVENKLKRRQFKTFLPEFGTYPYYVCVVAGDATLFKVEDHYNFKKIARVPLGSRAFMKTAIELLEGDEGHVRRILREMSKEDNTCYSDVLVNEFCDTSDDLKDNISYKVQHSLFKDVCGKIPQGTSDHESLKQLFYEVGHRIGKFAMAHSTTTDRNIYFVGPFVQNDIVVKSVTEGVDNFVKEHINTPNPKRMSAEFMRIDFTLSIGQHIEILGELMKSYCFEECYMETAGLGSYLPEKPEAFESLSLEFKAIPQYINGYQRNSTLAARGSLRKTIRMCTFFHPYDYKPDTFDLDGNANMREYWFELVETGIKDVCMRLDIYYNGDPSVQERLQHFTVALKNKVEQLRKCPISYGHCSVRKILLIREQALIDYGFFDAYRHQKHLENMSSLKRLPSVLKSIDEILDPQERFLEATRGFLAGNVYDWGSRAIADMLNSEKGLDFSNAKEMVKERPFFVDGYEEFSYRVFEGTYNVCRLFADNSGADFILGLIPFVRELVKHKVKVIIDANIYPAINDVTISDMHEIMLEICKIDPMMNEVFGKYVFLSSSGQGSPCLDLRTTGFGRSWNPTNSPTVPFIETEIDLVIFEGMGRAIHTNLTSNFKVDSLKAAIIKSKWLADQLKCEMFDVVFKFDTAM